MLKPKREKSALELRLLASKRDLPSACSNNDYNPVPDLALPAKSGTQFVHLKAKESSEISEYITINLHI